MQFLTRQTINQLEEAIKNSYSLPIFKGYKAVNKRGVEKLIDELYANLPDDVKRAREYLKSRNYEVPNKKKESFYDTLRKFEITLDEQGLPIGLGEIIILNIKEIEELLNRIDSALPDEILKAEILSRQ